MHVHTDFEAAFAAGTRFRKEHSGTVLIAGQPILVGGFQTTTGQVVLCDPYDIQYFWPPPVLQSIAPGSYPVFLATTKDEGGRRIAATCAKLVLNDSPVVEWRIAARQGDDESSEISTANFGRAEWPALPVRRSFRSSRWCYRDRCSLG